MWVTKQRGEKSGKNPQMSGFAFPFNKLFTGLWNRREARESTKVSGGERKSGNPGRGREPGALAIDLFLLNLEQKNGRWNEKKREKKGKSFVDSAATAAAAASFFLDMIHDISTRSGVGEVGASACP